MKEFEKKKRKPSKLYYKVNLILDATKDYMTW